MALGSSFDQREADDQMNSDTTRAAAATAIKVLTIKLHEGTELLKVASTIHEVTALAEMLKSIANAITSARLI